MHIPQAPYNGHVKGLFASLWLSHPVSVFFLLLLFLSYPSIMHAPEVLDDPFLAVYVGQGIYHHPLYRLRFIHQDSASFDLFFPPKTFLDRNVLHSIYMTCPPSGKQPQVLAASGMLYHL